MTAHFYKFQIGVCDANKGGAVIDVKMQYISIAQIYIIIEMLQSMLDRFKQTAVPYYTIINDTVNTTNLVMSQIEYNTLFCSLCPNLGEHNAEAVADEFMSSLDERTLDVTIDIEAAESCLTSTTLRPYLYSINGRHIFSFSVQSTVSPNWIHILRDLDILMI